MPVRLPHVCGSLLLTAVTGCGAFGGVFSSDDPPPAPVGPDAGAEAGTRPTDPPGIGLRGKATQSRTGETVSRFELAPPPGTREGDVLWAMVSVQTQDSVPVAVDPTPAGTFEKKWSITQSSSCANQSYAVLTRRATANEPTYGFTLSPPGQITAVVAAFYGVDERSPIDAERDSPTPVRAPAQGSSTLEIAPSNVTTTVEDTLVLYFLGLNYGATWSAPPGLELVADSNVVALAMQHVKPAGPVPTPTFAVEDGCSYENGVAKVVALRPRP